ncbi:hypothetical protein QFC24_006924 [Naganishia onofrii]|uniref:Uncharacterized protein n=1 Tax=Naganishia onofrii TaxID=1851511 RepID=A0ACC2WX58_9TREE|nr:hypothetical protein QFC24_006924 [Naganishia onofrii]
MVAILLCLTFPRLDSRMEMDDALQLAPPNRASPLEAELKASEPDVFEKFLPIYLSIGFVTQAQAIAFKQWLCELIFPYKDLRGVCWFKPESCPASSGESFTSMGRTTIPTTFEGSWIERLDGTGDQVQSWFCAVRTTQSSLNALPSSASFSFETASK